MYILEKLEDGAMSLPLTQPAFEFINCIDKYRKSPSKKEKSKNAWLRNLHDDLEIKIIEDLTQNFKNMSKSFWSKLYTYSLVNVSVTRHSNREIKKFLYATMRECTNISTKEVDENIECILNTTVITAGRLTLRENSDIGRTILEYGHILNTLDRPSIVQTTIVSATDLAKKDMQTFELIMDKILMKMWSNYQDNRDYAFKCIVDLVLQDNLKLNGAVLFALMLVTLHSDTNLATKAACFLANNMKTKNPGLFLKCLNEYPMVLNEYSVSILYFES